MTLTRSSPTLWDLLEEEEELHHGSMGEEPSEHHDCDVGDKDVQNMLVKAKISLSLLPCLSTFSRLFLNVADRAVVALEHLELLITPTASLIKAASAICYYS